MREIVCDRLTAALQAAVAVCALAALLPGQGCVDPGPIDPAMIARYQRAMLAAGPQRRDRPGPLREMLPPGSHVGPKPQIVIDEATGEARVELSLDEAIVIALANNPDIRVAGYNPGISRQEVIQAAAAFDYVAFGGFSIKRQDVRVNLYGARNLRTKDYEAGVRQTTVTGAAVALTGTLTWIRDHSFSRTSPSFEPDLTLSVTQPLLRGGWCERNLASLRVARINSQVNMAAFRQQVEQTVCDVITAYWLVVQAERALEIQGDLLAKTEATYERVKRRSWRDAAAVEIKQSEAAVEIRRALLIRARKNIGDAQEALGRLLSDKTLNAVANVEITPTTKPGTEVIALDVTDQLVTALEHSPLLAQARLAIQAADISVRVAENEQLPKLDFVGSVGLAGGGDTLHEATDRFWNGDLFNYEVGLALEYPIGNRQRRAQLRQRRYERLQAITQLQSAADNVATRVRERIRQVQAAHEEILAQHKAVEATEDQLQALEDTERIRGELTPEFLRLKLQAQGSLAVTQLAELQAIIDYNTAQADLDRTTGSVLAMHRVRVAMPVVLEEVSWDSPVWPNDMPAEDGQNVSPPAAPGNDGQGPAETDSEGAPPAGNGRPSDQPIPDPAPSDTREAPPSIAPPAGSPGKPVEAILIHPDDTIATGGEVIDTVERLSRRASKILEHDAASR